VLLHYRWLSHYRL